MKLNIKPISQRDPRCKDKKLGTSTVTTIGSHGVSSNRKFLLAKRAHHFSSMISSVHKLKVFQSIVSLYSILMVNLFIFRKWSFKNFRHHIAMFKHILTIDCHRVIWFIKQNITTRVYSSTTTPLRMISSSWIFTIGVTNSDISRRYYFARAFTRTIYLAYARCLESLMTYWTSFCFTRITKPCPISSFELSATYTTSNGSEIRHNIIIPQVRKLSQ